MQSYPLTPNNDPMGNLWEHHLTPLTPTEFLLFELERTGAWMDVGTLIWGSLSDLFKNRYQRNKAIETLFQADLIAIVVPPLGYHTVRLIKFEPKELT